MNNLKDLQKFALGTSEKREEHRELGFCTSLEIDGIKTLIDIPAGVDARREAAKAIPKGSVAKMNDKDFIELMGVGK